MDNYYISLHDDESMDIESDSDMRYIEMVFHDSTNHKTIGKFVIAEDNIGDWNDNMNNESKRQRLHTFIDNVDSNINDTLYFKQTNGEIKIDFKDTYMTFHISAELHECEFTVQKTEALMHVLKVIKQ